LAHGLHSHFRRGDANGLRTHRDDGDFSRCARGNMPRKHLPKGFLSGSYFPIWIDPRPTGAVVMVPAAYWPASLTMEWDGEQE
jgi:hypothetical protein